MSAGKRIRVAVLVGGASAEREISLASGRMIADHLPRDRYEPVLLDTLALMARNPRLSPELRERAQALVARTSQALLEPEDSALPSAFQDQARSAAAAAAPATEALAPGSAEAVDVAFIALHGAYGEDGTLQGMLELLGIPYVGSGVLASALAMDKAMAKKMMAAEGIPTPRGIRLARAAFNEDRAAALRLAEAVGVPAVVKPSRQGSSIGMSLVERPEDLPAALAHGFAYDSEVLVEERVAGTELTVGVIGNREPIALPVVEIVPKRAFFDYRAKYDPALSEEICPARLPALVAEQARELGLRAHRALGCRGLSRTDMILAEGDRGLVVLEVNTLPGMTVNSLLPKAAAAAGIPFGELLHRLVQLALEPPE
ncbi:MAG TPA: D-alanine--D-alanine ligase, partial [Vicinamibacteria bacterium]